VVATLALASCATADPPASPHPPSARPSGGPSASPSLPVTTPARLFGTNMPLFDANEQMLTNPGTRAVLRAWQIPFIRVPFRRALSDGVELSALEVIRDIGAQPMVIVQGATDENALADDVHELQLVASVFGADTVDVEYGNEEDVAGVDAVRYTQSWNAVVPTLTSQHPTYKFVGPVNFQWNPPYIAYFVAHAKPAPNYVSWHEYVCDPSASSDYCTQHIARWAVHVAETNAAERGAIGHTVPFFISEWNMDGSADPRYSDPMMIGPWTARAIAELESQIPHGLAGAMQYCADSHGDGFQLIDADDHLTPQGRAFWLSTP